MFLASGDLIINNRISTDDGKNTRNLLTFNFTLVIILMLTKINLLEKIKTRFNFALFNTAF